MRKGTVQADGKKVQNLREGKGWKQAKLAQIASIESVKTITKLEAGEPVLVETLGRVAVALGVDPQELIAGERAIDVAAATSRLSAAAQLPPLPALIIGRDRAFQDVQRRLGIASGKHKASDTPLRVALHGWPGVGKSTLVAAVAHAPETAGAYPDGVFWASLGRTPDVLSELAGWGRALGAEGVLNAKNQQDASRQLTVALRDKSALLILDDVWEIEHAAPFNVGGRKCAILVSTRIRNVAESLVSSPGDAYRLDVLADEDALKLLQVLAPAVIEKHPNECRELVRELEGLPLAVQVAGRLLHTEEKRGWDVRDLLRELREDAARILDAKAPADMVDLASETSPTVAALLRKSTDRLDPTTRGHFAALGAFVPKPGKFKLEAVAAVWEVPNAKAKRIVDDLLDRGLLEPIGDGRFWMHDLLAKHARALCGD